MSATAIVGLAPTILGPLTTVFTPPPACTVAVGQVDGGLLGLGLLGGGSTGNFAFLGQTCNGGQPADATTCWPATSSGAPPPPSPLRGWGVYSPGIECPAGYATACSATAGGTSGWPLQFQLTAGETAVGCCPSGYGCANIGGQTCLSIATSTAVPTVTCDGNKLGTLAFNTVPDAAASVTAFSLYAPMIQINFQSSDLPAEPTASSGVGVVPIPIPGQPAGTITTRTTTTLKASTPSPVAPASTQSQTQPGPQTTSSADSTSPTTLLTAPSSELLQTAPPSTTTSAASTSPSTSSSSTATLPPTSGLQSNNTSTSASTDSTTPATGFPRMAALGIGVGGGVAALLIGGSALMFFLRRRRNRREDENLDRLYGLGKLDSVTGSGRSDEFPGFYRGQMPTRPPPVREMHF